MTGGARFVMPLLTDCRPVSAYAALQRSRPYDPATIIRQARRLGFEAMESLRTDVGASVALFLSFLDEREQKRFLCDASALVVVKEWRALSDTSGGALSRRGTHHHHHHAGSTAPHRVPARKCSSLATRLPVVVEWSYCAAVRHHLVRLPAPWSRLRKGIPPTNTLSSRCDE